MEIKITISDGLIRIVKRAFNRRSVPFILGVLIFGMIVGLFADTFVIPYEFESGEVISSAQMNDNFSQIASRINALQTQVDALVASSGTVWDTNSPHIYYNGGNVGIGITTPAQKLHVAGSIQATGTAYAPWMMSDVYSVNVTNGTGTLDTGVSASIWEAFIGGISDQANVGHARHRYWIYETSGQWRLYVNYENSANLDVKLRVLFIRREMFSAVDHQGY